VARRLYAVESEARERGQTQSGRTELHLEHSVPTLNAVGAGLATEIGRTPPTASVIGKAIRYSVLPGEDLQNYLLDGAS